MAAGMEFNSNNTLKRDLEKYAAQYAIEQERQAAWVMDAAVSITRRCSCLWVIWLHLQCLLCRRSIG